MFSRSSQYAIKATIYIASQSMDCKRVGVKDVANEINTPFAFTAKVLQSLVRHGLIDSLKGPTGGYCIKPERLERLTLGDVITAIDGPMLTDSCVLAHETCTPDEPCPMHEEYQTFKEQLYHMLNDTYIKDFVDSVLRHDVVLKH